MRFFEVPALAAIAAIAAIAAFGAVGCERTCRSLLDCPSGELCSRGGACVPDARLPATVSDDDDEENEGEGEGAGEGEGEGEGQPGICSNETCNDARVLTGDSGTLSGSTTGCDNDVTLVASTECPLLTNGGDVVYMITVPELTRVEVTLASRSGVHNVSRFFSCPIGEFDCVQQGATGVGVGNGALESVDYYFVIDSEAGFEGTFDLSWSLGPL